MSSTSDLSQSPSLVNIKRRKKKKKQSGSIDLSAVHLSPSSLAEKASVSSAQTVWRTLSGSNSDKEGPRTPLKFQTKAPESRPKNPSVLSRTECGTRVNVKREVKPSIETRSQTGSGVEECPTTTSFFDYVRSELLLPSALPAAGDIWGQTERDRVYNAIAHVPYQLERLLLFGQCVALNSFLGVLTLLPIRIFRACWRIIFHCFSAIVPARPPGPPSAGYSHRSAASSSSFPKSPSSSAAVTGQQLFDCICGAISVTAVILLMKVNAGLLYFWLKDLTQEFLKLHVLFTALEIADRTLCNFGVDTLDALLGSCYSVASSNGKSGKRKVMADGLLALALVVLHCLVLMNQAMVFSVATNSKKKAMTALLIAANFVEIKGTIFKRFDSHKLLALTCQDMVERCHLALALLFVLAEDMKDNAGQLTDIRIVRQCGLVYGSEVMIDIIKHAILGKLNDVRPGIYREFMKDMCEKVVHTPSHRLSKTLGVLPYSVATIFMRIVITVLTLRKDMVLWLVGDSALWWGGMMLAGWALLCIFHFWFGYMLRYMAAMYLKHYEKQHARQRKSRMNTEPGT